MVGEEGINKSRRLPINLRTVLEGRTKKGWKRGGKNGFLWKKIRREEKVNEMGKDEKTEKKCKGLKSGWKEN